MLVGASVDEARAQNAGFVLDDMSEDMRHGYITGVVEGLAFSRYLRDKPATEGMKCFYDWLYQSKESRWPAIEQWLGRHRDQPVGALMYVLIKKECGE